MNTNRVTRTLHASCGHAVTGGTIACASQHIEDALLKGDVNADDPAVAAQLECARDALIAAAHAYGAAHSLSLMNYDSDSSTTSSSYTLSTEPVPTVNFVPSRLARTTRLYAPPRERTTASASASPSDTLADSWPGLFVPYRTRRHSTTRPAAAIVGSYNRVHGSSAGTRRRSRRVRRRVRPTPVPRELST